jgi:peptide deformylase
MSKAAEIVQYGCDVLRKPTAVVTKFDRKLEKLANLMLKTMYKANGVGLAAPQIGESVRMLVIDVDYNSGRYEDSGAEDDEPNPFIMINPVIVFREGEMQSYEGCLSFPDVFFDVKRARKIAFKFQDLNGKEHRMEAEDDLFCRCVQHEIDHLNGKLFIDLAIDKGIARKELDEHGFAGVKDKPVGIIL